jgi:hypothetical protein
MDNIIQEQTLIAYMFPEKSEGGLMQVEGAYIAETLILVEYVENKEDPPIQIVRTHQHNTKLALLRTATKFKKPFQSETKLVAAEDQAISTNYFKRKILKEEIERRY